MKKIRHFATMLDCTECSTTILASLSTKMEKPVHLGSTVDVNNWPPVHRWGIRLSSGAYLTVEEVEV